MANQSDSRVQKRQQKNKKKKKQGFRSIFLKILLGIFLFLCIGLIAGAGLFMYYIKDAPKLTDEQLDATMSSKVYASNGKVFLDIGAERREKITPTEIPQQLNDALVSVEDRRFYKHIGVDPIRIAGSALSNIRDGGKQGGSTLTQQLIKLSYYSTKAQDQTLKRKAQEAKLAVQLEKEKSKQEILTYYINKVYMSNGLYGMETASQAFFGKSLDKISLAQTALLAGMPNAPNEYDPYNHPEKAQNRRDTVLYTMLDNKKISQAEYDKAVATPVDDGLKSLKQENNDWKYYDNYIKEVINEVKDATGKDVYRDGLNIYTNLDIDAQKHLYEIVNSDKYVDYPDNKMQVASTLVEAGTGKVVAQIGGRKIKEGTILGNNLAVNTSRDFGSTVKPITDYGPAFEYLKYSAGKTIVDEPYNYTGTSIAVNNWDNRFMGSMTLRRALVLSRNVPAVKTFAEVEAENVSKFLAKLGIQYKEISQSNAISSNTESNEGTKYGISSEKMAAAYAAFANGGTYYKPHYVNKIVYQDGSEETEAFKSKGTKAMEEYTAYMITDILKGVITDPDGTGTNAAIQGLYQAGKTGTSNYTEEELAKIGTNVSSPSPDISFAGYTKHYSMAVWTGYNKKLTPVTSLSSNVASDVYREMMQFISASVDNEDWTMPNDLIRVGNELYIRGHYDAPASSTYNYSRSSTSTTSSASESKDTTESSSASSSTESSSTSASSSSSQSQPETDDNDNDDNDNDDDQDNNESEGASDSEKEQD